MFVSRAWIALVRRNFVYRRRYWFSTLLELALPVAFVAILVAIKNALGDDEGTTIIEPTFPSQYDAYAPLSFNDYLLDFQSTRQCFRNSSTPDSDLQITAMPYYGLDWQNPFVICDYTKCQEDGEDAFQYCQYNSLAVAYEDGGSARAQAFADYIYSEYPLLTNGSLPFDHDFVMHFDSSADIDKYVESADYGTPGFPKISMAVVWSGSSSTNYKYALRQNSTGFNVPAESERFGAWTTPDTERLFDHFAPNDESCEIFDGAPFVGFRQGSCTGQYLYNGIITMQKLVGDFILHDSGAITQNPSMRIADNGVRFVPFPTKQYEEGGFFADVASFVPLLVTLGLLYPVACLISYIVREKELRQKELMKMMSVTEWDIGSSWFFSFFYIYIIVASLCTVVSANLFEHSDTFLLWLLWVLTLVALVVFAMFLATFSSKTIRSVLVGLLFVFIGVFLTMITDVETGNAGTISLISLHPIGAFSFGMLEIGRLEDAGVGLTTDTMSETSNPSGYTFANTLASLIADIVIWSLMTWYCNRVIKPDFGQALPFYFPFTTSYWFGTSSASSAEAFRQSDEDVNTGVPIEGVSENVRAQTDSNIIIRHLGKKFGEKTAVDDLSFTMYSGQVTALLGHNGAGKTTSISMLTGALAPTSGSVSLLGKDLASQLNAVRGDLGICLQHDCLFPDLTVREHLQFFSRLKGLYSQMSNAEAEEHIDQIIKDVALFEKRDTFSKNLSGGMKRKLSVAMAFSGGSKVVLLDEPTSGMDPFSRRFTWNVIRQYRQNRCILLTTHFMDEADVLGDRIAIMSEGQLRCVGSPLFLKKHYGVGYQLTIEKDHGYVDGASSAKLDELDDRLSDLVCTNVKDATLLNNVGTELSFQLPVGEAGHFGPMFDGIDQAISEGKVSSYGVGITTLEEVFLLVARGDQTQPGSRRHYRSSRALGDVPAMVGKEDESTEKSARSRMDLNQDDLFFSHVRALLGKRAANFRRDKKAWLCTTILPSVFVLGGLLILKFAVQDRNMSPLLLSLDDYNPNVQGTPRNPIFVNDVDTPYQCSPGICSYGFGNGPVFEDVTGELHVYCGMHASPGPLLGESPLCTVSDSTPFMQTISEDGAVVYEQVSTSTINESAHALFESAETFQATQYGAIYYTHDPSSTLPTGELYDDVVVENCTDNLMYLGFLADTVLNDANDCARYTGLGYVIQYNFTAPHVTPTFMAVATEGIARHALQNDEFTIESTIDPLPITHLESAVVESEDTFTLWFLLVLSFPFISGSFGVFVVAERESKAKHLQTVTGVKPSGYWLSTYLWDVMNYQLPLWISIAMFFIFDTEAITSTKNGVFGCVLVTMMLYGPASAGFVYCTTFFFSSPNSCNVINIITSCLLGMGGTITTAVLTLLGKDPSDPNGKLYDIAVILTWVLRFHPAFCFARSAYFSVSIGIWQYFFPGVTSAWDPKMALYDIIFLAWQSVLYPLLAVQIDIWSTNPKMVSFAKSIMCCFGSGRAPEVDITRALAEDSDVLEEEERVATGGANNDIIVVDKLTKIYDNGKKAVNSLSLGIPPGQVFGLLGVNGAGKTTTMQMLTAEFPATTGDATLAGYSVSREPEKTRRRVGYCPQFDAHFANMTGREHVELYATIKGIPSDLVSEAAATKLDEVGLSAFDSDRLAANYSGGMKRRLSLACATIGEPQIVFLDECSTGVDPVARREIWELVSNMVSGKNVSPEERTSVILTTHSMEECEALCPRIGIMANGRLRALGSAQHLKNKFGQGFQVEMKCKIVNKTDDDFVEVATKLGQSRGVSNEVDEEGVRNIEDVFFNLDQTLSSLHDLTGDDYLASLVSEDNPLGYNVFKGATSLTGVTLDELAAFATVELRIRRLAEYVAKNYATNVLRERQDTKVRYEVNAEGIQISKIFASLEANKKALLLDDYGVSQTSLEQVFNMHAAEAEKLKHGTTDG